jgi:hypothetical protein
MSYRLIKSQIGGGNCEILILIAVIVVAWFLFVQSNSPKKEKSSFINCENFTIKRHIFHFKPKFLIFFNFM